MKQGDMIFHIMRRSFFICFGVLASLLSIALLRSEQPPKDLESLRALIPQAISWIQEQRQLHRPVGRSLNEQERKAFAPFFPAEVLEEVRLAMAPRITNPPFVEDFGTREDGRLIYDVRSASGIAFIDTVILVEPKTRPGSPQWYSLLFHELVHLTQYRELGVEGFVESYVESMAEVDFEYPDIAHEAQAFGLQYRYSRAPDEVFSVTEEVRETFRLAGPTSP